MIVTLFWTLCQSSDSGLRGLMLSALARKKDCAYFCFLFKSTFICYCNTQLSFWSVIVLYPEIWSPCYNQASSECIQGGSQNEWQELIITRCPQDVKLRVSGTSVLQYLVPLMTKHAKLFSLHALTLQLKLGSRAGILLKLRQLFTWPLQTPTIASNEPWLCLFCCSVEWPPLAFYDWVCFLDCWLFFLVRSISQKILEGFTGLGRGLHSTKCLSSFPFFFFSLNLLISFTL